MDSSPQSTANVCPKCGAALSEGATSCWLCLAPLTGQEALPATIIPPAPQAENTASYSLSSLLMLVTLVCVLLGLFTFAPGLGMLIGFVGFVAWLSTVVKVQKRRAKNQEVTNADKILLFVRSAVGTILIMGLVLVACVATLFVACVAMLGNMH
jgi:hypothetical protein